MTKVLVDHTEIQVVGQRSLNAGLLGIASSAIANYSMEFGSSDTEMETVEHLAEGLRLLYGLNNARLVEAVHTCHDSEFKE